MHIVGTIALLNTIEWCFKREQPDELMPKKMVSPTQRRRINKCFSEALSSFQNPPKIDLRLLKVDFHFSAAGSKRSGKGRIAIGYPRAIQTSNESLIFIFRHEMAHIILNHTPNARLKLYMRGAFYSAVGGFIFPPSSLLSFIANIAISSVISCIDRIPELRMQEIEADRMALLQSSDNPKILEGGINFFSYLMRINQGRKEFYIKKGSWERHLIKDNGDDLSEWYHPPLSERIQALQNKRDASIRIETLFLYFCKQPIILRERVGGFINAFTHIPKHLASILRTF